MKVRILIIIGAIALFSNGALAQYTDIVIPYYNNAAADINNTNSSISETYANQSDLFTNSKNELNLFNTSASIGTSIVASKYVSVYNIPISFSFKSKLFFRKNEKAYENLSCKVVIPITQKKFEDFDMMTGKVAEFKASGLGDLVVKMNYNLAINKMIFSFGIHAKLATAKKENMVRLTNFPVGTGSTDVNLSLFFSKPVGSKINVHSSLGYDIRGKFETNNITYDYGNETNILVGGDYFIKFMNIGSELSYISSQNSKNNDPMASAVTPGLTSIDAIPYIKVNLPLSMTAKLFGVVPLSSNWKSVDGFVGSMPDPDRKVKIGFSLLYRFEKSAEQK